jgi:uridine kinase
MPRRIGRHAAVAEIAAVADEFPRRTAFVGIDGPGGAGKTSFAELAVAIVPRAVVVHIDDFASPRIPEWDWERFREQVSVPLLTGRPAHYQRWDWDTDSGAEWHDVPTRCVLLVEGVSCTRAEVRVPWDYTVWLDAPLEVRLRRARERDGAEMVSRWLEDWIPSEDRYIERERPQDRVDVIVDGTDAGSDLGHWTMS